MNIRAWGAALLLLPLLAVSGCRERLFGHASNVVVLNESHCSVTVFVDGWKAFTVRDDSTRIIDNVGSGRHVLEAKDDLGRLVERRYIELQSGEDYYWRITSCPPR
jgi:hypothetical protein